MRDGWKEEQNDFCQCLEKRWPEMLRKAGALLFVGAAASAENLLWSHFCFPLLLFLSEFKWAEENGGVFRIVWAEFGGFW